MAAVHSTSVADIGVVSAWLLSSFRMAAGADSLPTILLTGHASRFDLASHLREEFTQHRLAAWSVEVTLDMALCYLEAICASSRVTGL